MYEVQNSGEIAIYGCSGQIFKLNLNKKLGKKINFNTMAYYSRKLKIPFQNVLDKVIENLKQQGFGIITTIDVKDTFKQKLNVSFRNYKILGACNPQFAYKAISLESHMGIVLPCNVVVQEHENGEVEVTAMSPLENMSVTFKTTQLVELASEVGDRLRAAIDNLHRETSVNHVEALPPEKSNGNKKTQILG